LCTVLGLLQKQYIEKKNKKFIQICRSINGKNQTKQKKVGNIIVEEINKIVFATKLPENGPYELETTCKILSEYLNCQFIIFNGIHQESNILFMYPSTYQDNLHPIFIYNPNLETNHLVYIKRLSSFYSKNFRICFACKKNFKAKTSKRPMHLCRHRTSCFCCRRFYQSSSTYINESLKHEFCDRNVTKELSFQCTLCNLTIFSKHCLQGHRRFCSGSKGNFGYKCLTCGQFTYRTGNTNFEDMVKNHVCGLLKKQCLICFKENEFNHLCELKKDKISIDWPKLGFIVFDEYLKEDQNIPFCALIYREENERGNFTKYTFFDANFNSEVKESKIKETNSLFFKYFLDTQENKFETKEKPPKQTDDFKINYNKLQNINNPSFMESILQFILNPNFLDTTYICADNHSIFLMSILKTFISNGFIPTCIRNHQNIILLEIKAFKIRFLSMNQYLNGTIYDIAKQFDIQFDQHFFPSSILLTNNINNYTIPSDNCFFTPFDNEIEKTQKTEFLKKNVMLKNK
jgi:hypothetical protein